MSLDIHKVKSGDKIIYANPDGGYLADTENGKKFLVLNNIYTVDGKKIHEWHTDIILKEFPLERFNSCLFESIK